MADEISIHDSVTTMEDEITYDDSKKEAIEKEWRDWLKAYENHSNWYGEISSYAKLQILIYQSVEEEYWEILVEAYEKVPIARKATMPNCKPRNQTALHLLVARPSAKEVVEKVLRHINGDDVKIKDEEGNTVLHRAAAAKGIQNIDRCKLILFYFPDLIEECNNQGKTALSLLTRGLLEGRHRRRGWNTAVDGYEAMINTLNVTTLSPHSTPLHMAFGSFGNEDVKKTFEKVKDKKNILKIKDENGNTALHLLVASKPLSWRRDLCKRMADACRELVNEANFEGETPLFINAIRGHNYNIRYGYVNILQRYVDPKTIDMSRSDGNTTLHCALLDEKFLRAYQILQMHSSFRSSQKNKDGFTPLRILANKPYLFRSRTPLTMMERIIYSCIWVVDLEKPRYNEVDYCRQALSECFKPVKRLIMSGSQTMQKVFSSRSCYLGDTKNPKDESESVKDLEKPDHKQIIEEDSLTDSGSTEIEGSFIMWLIKFLIERYMVAPIKSFIKTCMTPFMIIGKFVKKIENIKRRHMLVYKIMEKLLLNYDAKCEESSNATILIAVEKGVTEMVEGILRKNHSAAYCKTANGKSVMLLSIENRQADVYELLTKRNLTFGSIDDGWNNALHVAATRSSRQPGGMPKIMQLLWEIKWYNYVRDTMPDDLSIERNEEGKTPSDVFLEEHKDLIEKNDLGEWLNKTSQSCSVVAGLVATVAYSSATTIPGGNNQEGVPYFKGHPAFGTFVISAFIALCFSLISLVMFLALLMSPYLGVDDAKSLPTKLVVALFSLLVSIGTMLVSFCAGHFFSLNGTLTYAAAPLYVIGCLVIAFLLITQFNSYTSLLWSLSRRKPRPWYDRDSIESVVYAAYG